MAEIKRNGSAFYTLEDFGEGSVVSCQLMDHHYITLKFSTAEPVYFEIGDYIELEDFGYFELISPYFPTQNTSTGGYDYELQLYADYWKWKNKVCKYRPKLSANETSFELTSSIGTHLQIIIDNLNALGYKHGGKNYTYDYTTFNKDVFDTKKAFHVSYSSISIIDALNAICEELDCEWWVDGSIIYLGYCEMTGQTTFEQGVNVLSMSQSDSKSDYITRLYAFGSDRNIPKGYFTGADADVTMHGVASEYLMLPDKTEDSEGYVAKNGYLENTNIVKNEEQAIEGVVMFDDEYPKVECTVTNIKTYTSKGEEEDGTEYEQTFYQLADTNSSFTSKFESGWIKSGLTLMIKFTSGSMNGMEFECTFKIIDGVNYFEVVVNDEYGRDLPDEALHPKVGDSFFLYNWDASKITETNLIDEARESLYERAKNYYKKSMIDASNFTCVMEDKTFYNNGVYDYHPLGEQVKLIHPMFADTDAEGNHYRNSRIIGFEIKLDIPYDGAQYIVGEKASYSRLGQLEDTIDSITVNGGSISGGSGTGSNVYVIGVNDLTPATDANVYSARRSDKQFVSTTKDQSVTGKKTFEDKVTARDGIKVGEDSHNYGIDKSGDAVLGDIVGEDGSLQRVHDKESTEAQRVMIGAQGFDLYKADDGRSYLWVDILNVRTRAYFASLEIRKVSYSGGTLLLSPAGSTIMRVTPMYGTDGTTIIAYKCHATADDGTTATQNWWKVGMQALCQTFNIESGRYTDVSNQYYWRLVLDVGQEELEDGKLYDYVTLSNVEKLKGDEAAIPYTDDGGKTAYTTLLTKIQAQDDRTDDQNGTSIASRYFYGCDEHSTEPKSGDVIVCAGDQVLWRKRGNTTKITTSTDDGDDDNAPSIVMYHGMGAPYTTGAKGTDGNDIVNPYQWKTVTSLQSPEEWLINADRFKMFSGDLDNIIEPLATWYEVSPTSAYLTRHADGTTTPEDVEYTLRKRTGDKVTPITDNVLFTADLTLTDGTEKTDVPMFNGKLSDLEIDLSTIETLSVTAWENDVTERATCEMVILSDTKGTYSVELYTNTGDKILNGQGDTTIYARLFCDVVEVKENLEDFIFTWKKYDQDGNLSNWHGTTSPEQSGYGLDSVTLTSEDVEGKATVICEVDR